MLPVLCLALALSGCGEAGPAERGEPRWLRLAESAAAVRVTLVDGGEAAEAPHLVHEDGETWFEIRLAPQDWKRQGTSSIWRQRLGFELARQDPRLGDAYRLRCGERELEAVRPHEFAPDDGSGKRSGSFFIEDEFVLARLHRDERFEEEAVLSVRLRGEEPGGPLRVRGRRFSGDGIAVWPGERAEVSCDLPPASVLRFAHGVEPLMAHDPPPLTLRVRLDGDVVFERTVDPSKASYGWHAVELPPEGLPGARVAFEASGGLAYATFFAPTIGPAEAGTYGERPWPEPRPDLVLFVADTFRADNLALYGGTEGTAPGIDRLVQESLAFRRAWSTSTYTLPGHASMFSGVYPRQAGINSLARALPDEIATITERLQAAGYRTGAITDAGIVSQSYAFDQGFEWFDEIHNGISRTIERARAFLDADDGRPVFLFVQSYRSHRPYRPGVEDRVGPQANMALAREAEAELLRVAHEQGIEGSRPGQIPGRLEPTPDANAVVDRLEELYRDAVSGLDRGFVAFHDLVSERGLLDRGLLIFTSDHGESFAEHGSVFHGNEVYESETRIPMLLFGGPVEPRVVDHAASLVDLAPTLAAMAGVEPSPEWEGANLLTLEDDRVLYSFECMRERVSTLSIIDGHKKVIAYEDLATSDEPVLGAFDLERDPREQEGLAPNEESWPRELLDRLGVQAPRLLEPIYEPAEATIDDDKAAELGALGYGG